MQDPRPPNEVRDGGWRRFSERHDLLLSLLLPALLLGFSRGFIMPVLPVMARDEFKVGAAAATLVSIATMAGSVIATLPTGYLMDRIGRRKILIAGPFLTAISSALVLIVHTYAQVLACLIVGGMAQQMWQIGRLTAIADTGEPGRRGRMITSMSSLQRAGALLGPFLGGIVSSTFGLRAPFALSGAIAVLAALTMVFFMHESAPRLIRKRAGDEDGAGAEGTGKLLTYPVVVLLIGQFTANMARGGTIGNAGPPFIFAAYAYGLAPLELGAISLIVGVAGIPITLLAGYIMDRFGRKRTVVPASAVLAIGLGLIAATAALRLPLAAFVGFFVLANLAVSFMAGSMQTIGADVAPASGRGRFFGLARLTATAGSLSNPVVFAAAVSTVALPGGYALGFAIMGVAGVLTSALIGWLLKETLVRPPAKT